MIHIKPLKKPGQFRLTIMEKHIADCNAREAGTLMMEINGRTLALWKLYIKPQFRKQGLGTELIQTACNFGDPNLQTVALMVAKRNIQKLEPWYEKLGFRLAMEYPDGDILMVKFR